MAVNAQFVRPSWRCLRCSNCRLPSLYWSSRAFQTTTASKIEATVETENATPEPPLLQRPLDPNTVATPRLERRLPRTTRQQPIGSRRRRAALRTSANIPFEQLPYQCFQEARKILLADREDKLKQIEEERRRIAKVQATPAEKCGEEYVKKGRLVRMQKYLEHLKILADINDPVIKKRFEDGDGDMTRPIYRFLADRRWRQQRRLILMQRVNQMHVVPDVVPSLDPTAEVRLAWGRRITQPGEIVNSRVSEEPPRLNVQVFDQGERLVSIAVVDPDVPNVETDGFDSRCHFLAVNVPISPTSTAIPLSKPPGDAHIVKSWLPPHAQKGSPYHRLVIFIIQQQEGKILEPKEMEKYTNKHNDFNMTSVIGHLRSKAIGVHLFRTIWDESMADVMQRAGIEGANIELKRKKPEKLPYKKKDGERYR
ncbi:MAG: hypothetical protein Q9201_003611 [Fulgogasparrea decipioides]